MLTGVSGVRLGKETAMGWLRAGYADRLYQLGLFSSFLSQTLPSQLVPPSLQSVLKEAPAVSCCVCQPLGIPEHNLVPVSLE